MADVEAKSMSDCLAIVTGAGRGIGRAIAVDLARLGMRMALLARGEPALVAVAGEIGPAATVFPLDVRHGDDVRRVFREIRMRLGPPAVLVNAAGVYHFGPMAEAGEDDFDTVMDTNLKGIFLTCREAIRQMQSEGQGGDIVNIASIAGKVGTARRALYCASKFGVVGLSQALAEEVREEGIRVTVVCPGSTNTQFSLREVAGRDVGKMLQPGDVAHAVRMVVCQPPTSFMSEIVMRPTRRP